MLVNRFQKEKRIKVLVISLVSLTIICFVFTDPIGQEIHYHEFSNDFRLWGIPNFWNVISNVPFLIIGTLGLVWWSNLISFSRKNNLEFSKKWFRLETLVFAGLIFIGLGSSYYHLNPTIFSLFWDRLPMALVFAVLFVLVIRDFVSFDWSKKIQVPVILFSLLSVVYWLASEYLGRGDLRPYVIVQFLPLVCIPYFLYLNNYGKKSKYIWWSLVFYVLAKAAEHFDTQIFEFTHFLAGHPIKHLLAAIAMVFISKHIQKHVQ